MLDAQEARIVDAMYDENTGTDEQRIELIAQRGRDAQLLARTRAQASLPVRRSA